MKFTVALLGVAAMAGLASAPAHAADIIYAGSQQFNSNGILAKYTIETDGSTGAITAANIVHFTIDLSDSNGAYHFDDTTGTVKGNVFANATSIYEPTQKASSLTFTSDQMFNGLASGQLIFNHYANQVQIEDANGGRYFSAPGTAVIGVVATPAVSPVPEPAAWAMMVLGMGAIGYVMRRRRIAARVACAALLLDGNGRRGPPAVPTRRLPRRQPSPRP